MGWTTFFQNNSQSLFTLTGIFLGSLITFLISYLNNSFQAKERDKDRLEQRKNAKVQLTLELRRNDVKVLEDSIQAVFEAFNSIVMLRYKYKAGVLSNEQMEAELKSWLANENGQVSKLADVSAVSEMLSYTFGDKIFSEYQKFSKLIPEYGDISLNPDSSDEERENINLKVVSTAAKLHTMLREKLISLRDT